MYRIKGTSGELINQSFPLKESLVIGSADDCDVRIDSPDVLPHHCKLSREPGGQVMIDPLAGGVVRINGQVAGSGVLASGDEVAVGNCRFMLQAPGLRPQRVLTEEATRARPRHWKWLVPALVALALWYAWYGGWLAFPPG